jgi:hypothetical protein
MATLQLMKKEYDVDENASVSFEVENDELHESNIKCVSYVFKILSIELFDSVLM